MRRIKADEVLVLDLDGTLIPYNSFHRWLADLVRRGVPGSPLRGRLTALAAVAGRGARVASHQRMKLSVMAAWRDLARQAPERAQAQAANFADRLLADFRPELLGLVAEARRKGAPCLLATAAPEDYAAELNRSGLFDGILSSRIVKGILDENRYERKRDNVLAELSRRGWEGRAVVLATDHRDDAPLCDAARFVYWYGPSAAWETLRTGSDRLAGEPRLDLAPSLASSAG